jgi:hypothetical protein
MEEVTEVDILVGVEKAFQFLPQKLMFQVGATC